VWVKVVRFHDILCKVVTQSSLGQDPRLFDWKAAIAASLHLKGERKLLKLKQLKQEVQLLEAAVDVAESGACIDQNTPEDGHCLFHALAAGGLLSDIPESLTVDELREIALQGATMQQLQIAADGTGAQGITIEEYVEGMRQGLYGDNLIIGLLASFFQRSITVIRRDYTRTFLPNGDETPGTVVDAIWIAHYGEAQFFDFLRAGHASASAATRGQALVVRSRLDTACGGIGKRRLVRNSRLWHGSATSARPGKRRQTGGRRADDEPDGLAEDEKDLPYCPMPDYKDVPYCHARQRSPDCVRGGKRLARGEAPKKQRGLSLWGLQDMSEAELAKWCFEAGFLKDRRETLCPKCGQADLKMHGERATYVCKDRTKCRYEESCTRREPGLFVERVALSKQMQLIYRMVYHNAPGKRECAADADMDSDTVARIQSNVRQIASYWMIRANVLLQVGGEDMDCEADEVSFRSKKVFLEGEAEEGAEKVMWIRFLSVARRGSSLVYFNDLEDRYTAAGKGGGGKITEEEVGHHFLRAWLRDLGHEPKPLLARWSVLHTDGADAYRKLHRETGILEKYGTFKWWHTWVRHSKKKCKDTGVMLPVQFTVRKCVKLKDGSPTWRKGGTQKKDGWFANVRKHVSRRAHATDDRNGIRELVYFFQWCYWRTRDPEADAIRGCHDKAQPPLFDLLTELGKFRRRVRERLGDEFLAKPGWLHTLSDEQLLEDLPKPHLGHSRLSGKTPPPVPQLGARKSTKPADWPRGSQSKGVLMASPHPGPLADMG
jgi:hypothetical protein